MSRSIISKRTITSLDVAPPKEDPYVSKVIKLVPVEIITVYSAVFNIIKSNTQNAEGNATLQWIIFAVIFVITPF